jgi:hypothetical protein
MNAHNQGRRPLSMTVDAFAGQDADPPDSPYSTLFGLQPTRTLTNYWRAASTNSAPPTHYVTFVLPSDL